MKSCAVRTFDLDAESLPVRGAWIEIGLKKAVERDEAVSLPVRGAWIEIAMPGKVLLRSFGRSPCGERGLK